MAASEVSDGTTLTLERAIEMALRQNPNIRASAARVEAASGRAVQAGLWSNPELEFGVEEWVVSGSGKYSDSKQTIGVSQTLPWPGKKSLARRSGTAGVRLSGAELDLRRTEIVRDVKIAFYHALAAERSLDVGQELLRVAESSANAARQRVEAGATPYQEQLRAEVQLEQAQAELVDLRRDREVALQDLAALIGGIGSGGFDSPHLSPLTSLPVNGNGESEAGDVEGRAVTGSGWRDGNLQLEGTLMEAPDEWLLNVDPEVWLATHPSMRVAAEGVTGAELEARRARLEPYPDLTVGVAGGRIGESDESIIELSVSIRLPVFDRGQGRKQEARANVTTAEAEAEAVRVELLREWAGAVERYRAAAEQVAGNRERLLPKANEALRLVQVGFEEGKFSFIDLVDTQRTTAEARLSYQGKVLALNVARAELEALVKPVSNSVNSNK